MSDGAASEECIDVKCTVCRKKNRVRQAVKYCKKCKKNLCSRCVEIHDDYNDGHTLMGEFGDDEVDDVLTETCERHEDKLVDMFCVDHDELVCSVCALLDHRKCDTLTHLTDESSEALIRGPNIENIPDQLRLALVKVDKAISALNLHMETLSQKEQDYLQEIENYAQKLLSKIEKMKVEAVREVSRKHEQFASDAREKREECERMRENLRKSIECIKDAEDGMTHLFVLMKKGQAMKRGTEALCKDSDSLVKRDHFVFRSDKRIGASLDDTESLGTTGKYKVSSKEIINTKTKIDANPNDLEGVCLLPGGMVVTVDDSNKRLKHIDPSTQSVEGQLDLKGDLRAIAHLGSNTLAVCKVIGEVQMVINEPKLSLGKTIKLDHESFRIAHSNGELFVADLDRVHVHDIRGNQIRTIGKNERGINLFSRIRGIVLNSKGDKVYIVDEDKGLVCTNKEGHELFTCMTSELNLSKPYGVCTDDDESLFVCGYGSNNVVQVTTCGHFVGEILSASDGVTHPRCLCYDADRRRLFVGGETPNLMVYKLV